MEIKTVAQVVIDKGLGHVFSIFFVVYSASKHP